MTASSPSRWADTKRSRPKMSLVRRPLAKPHEHGVCMHILSTVTAVVASMSLCACGAWQGVSDTSSSAYQAVFHKQVKILNVDLNARASLNPDEANRPVSVAVRVYQLKDRKSFDGASYDD